MIHVCFGTGWQRSAEVGTVTAVRILGFGTGIQNMNRILLLPDIDLKKLSCVSLAPLVICSETYGDLIVLTSDMYSELNLD